MILASYYYFCLSVPIGDGLFFQPPKPPGAWGFVPGGLNPGGWNGVEPGVVVVGFEPGGLKPPDGWKGTDVVDAVGGLVWFATGGLKPGGWKDVGGPDVAFWLGFHCGAVGGLNAGTVDCSAWPGCWPDSFLFIKAGLFKALFA